MYNQEVVNAIRKHHNYEYCIVNPEFEVLMYSKNIVMYCDQSVLQAKTLYLFDIVPELVGMEDDLQDIIEGTSEELRIPLVFKEPNNYVNIHVYLGSNKERLIVLFENITAITKAQQKLLQANNDNLLLLEEIEAQNRQLAAFNTHMKQLVDEEVAKNLEQQHMMELQTRHAQMGEMIAMITHQWKQPLSVIQTVGSLLKMKYELGSLDQELFREKMDNLLMQATHMSQTVTDFQKATTDENIAYSFSGDRDNVKGIQTKNTKIEVPDLQLQVKELPKGTQIVGDFKLEYKIKHHKATAYEPLPFQMTIQGIGYPPLLNNLLQGEGNFTRFTEQPIVKTIASIEGTHTKVTYPMALSHDQNFTLQAIKINAFNPHTERSYTLDVPAQTFTITQEDKSKLLDKVDTPAPFEINYAWLQTFFGYLIAFIAGIFSALSWKWKRKTIQKLQDPMLEKIQQCKSSKELLQLLLSDDSKRFDTTINTIESTLYQGGGSSLQTLKKSAIKELK
jgi:putative sterol carrier protein